MGVWESRGRVSTRKEITEALLKAGEQGRTLGRSESKLGELKSAEPAVLIGDATDAAFLTKALRGRCLHATADRSRRARLPR